MIAVFLHSPSDHLGYIEEHVFQVIMATYLGKPCPEIAPVACRCVGSKEARADKYRANLAAIALPGQGHIILHNKLQLMAQSMVKLGGSHLEREAVNFLLGEVGDPHITPYVNHVARQINTRRAKYPVVLVMHASNFPAGCQTVNDSGVISAAEAIFEVKTYTSCNTRYNFSNKTHAADRRARIIATS